MIRLGLASNAALIFASLLVGSACGADVPVSFKCTSPSAEKVNSNERFIRLKDFTRRLIGNYQVSQNHPDQKKSDEFRKAGEDCWELITYDFDSLMQEKGIAPQEYQSYLKWLSAVGTNSAASSSVALLASELQKSWESKFVLPAYVRTKPNFNDFQGNRLAQQAEIDNKLNWIQKGLALAGSLASMNQNMGSTTFSLLQFKSALTFLIPFRNSMILSSAADRALDGSSNLIGINQLIPSLNLVPKAPAEIMTLAFPTADAHLNTVLSRDRERRTVTEFARFTVDAAAFATTTSLAEMAFSGLARRNPALKTLLTLTTAVGATYAVDELADGLISPENLQKNDIATLNQLAIKASNLLLDTPSDQANSSKRLMIAKKLVDVMLKLDTEKNLNVYKAIASGQTIPKKALSEKSTGLLARYAMNQDISRIKCDEFKGDEDGCANKILTYLKESLQKNWANPVLQNQASRYLTSIHGETAAEQYHSLETILDAAHSEYLNSALASTGYSIRSPHVVKLSSETDELISQIVAIFYKADQLNRDAIVASMDLPALDKQSGHELNLYTRSKTALNEIAKSVLVDRLLNSVPFYLGVNS